MAITAPTTGPVGSPSPPITLLEFVTYLQDAAPGTSEQQAVLTAAIGWVEERCGPITATDVRVLAAQRGRYSRDLVLPVRPVGVVTAVLDPQALDVIAQLEAEDVNWRAGVITAPYHRDGDWQIRLTTARTTAQVADLKEATLIIGKHLWESRNGLARSGMYSSDRPVFPPGYAIPSRAAQLLEGFIVSGH